MSNLDYLHKEIENEFVFSTTGYNRETVKEVCINGRMYDKYGTEQAVTFAGIVYKVFDTVNKKYVRVLHVGLSKQNPADIKTDKQVAVEYAKLHALEDPVLVMRVEDYFNFHAFRDLVTVYLNTMRLQFMKTRQEIRENELEYNVYEHCIKFNC